MKKITKFLFVIASILTLQQSIAQDVNKLPLKIDVKQLIILKSTANCGNYLLNSYFNTIISKKILTQISDSTFDSVKKYCNKNKYPDCIIKLLNTASFTSNEALDKIWMSLTFYRIATFDNIRNGENFGEQSLLVAPAKENKNIGGDCNYDKDFYIIIPTKDLEIIK